MFLDCFEGNVEVVVGVCIVLVGVKLVMVFDFFWEIVLYFVVDMIVVSVVVGVMF